MRMNANTQRLICWIWLEEIRSSWRRPPYAGPARLGLNLAIAGALVWLVRTMETPAVLPRAPLLIAALAAMRLIFGLFDGAQNGRRRLLTPPVQALVHTTPVPPDALVTAQILARLPAMAGGGLWGAILPWSAGAAFPASLAGWAVCTAAGAAGLLLGTLSLLWWASRWPRGLAAGVTALQLAQMAGIAWAVSAAFQGRDPGTIRVVLITLPALTLALPGLALLAGMAFGPELPGDRYRAAWLALRETAGQGGPRRSCRVTIPGLPAVAGRDWLALWRNPIGRFRIAVTLVIMISAPFLGRWLGIRAGASPELWVPGAGLALWHITCAEWIASAFTGEGTALDWYRLAPVRPSRALWGKWAAQAAASALPFAAAEGLMAAGAGLPVLPAAITVLVGTLGAGSVLLGLTACSARTAASWGGPGEQLRAWVGEQIPRSAGALAGFLGSGLYLAILLWPGEMPVRRLILAAAPVAALLMGHWRLSRTWTAGTRPGPHGIMGLSEVPHKGRILS